MLSMWGLLFLKDGSVATGMKFMAQKLWIYAKLEEKNGLLVT